MLFFGFSVENVHFVSKYESSYKKEKPFYIKTAFLFCFYLFEMKILPVRVFTPTC